jgi:transcriptional regulator with XRE-family HTH domain
MRRILQAGPPAVHDPAGNRRRAAQAYHAGMDTQTVPAHRTAPQPFGEHLRQWRQRRRMSQLDLAHEAEISTRHLSFVETGRSAPSREMVLRLAERLQVPLRERNAMLMAAGYAPMYRERPLGDPALAAARQAVELILKSHEPYPALAVDRHWNLLAGNAMLPYLTAGAHPSLLEGQPNVLRLSLHPKGVAAQIVNLRQWREHLFERLQQQVQSTGDATLAALLEELRGYPVPEGTGDEQLEGEMLGVAMPLRFRTAFGVLNFISTTTVFGTPVDITLQELALETFFPADPATGNVLRQIYAQSQSQSQA